MSSPRFERPLPVAQINIPEEDAVMAAFEGIFARGYYANHGPLVRQLDQALAHELGVRHAICVVNGTVALILALQALLSEGKGSGPDRPRPEVIVPSFTFPATVQAISWAGAAPVFCDVDPETHCIDAARAEPLVGEHTAGILAVHTWGRPADVPGLEALAKRRGLFLLYDAAHAIGCELDGRRVGGFGDAEAFSLHATKIVHALEGGVVTTNDDALADRLRTARSFHADQTFAAVPLRMNAKMSEAQAAFGLLSLAELPANIEANRARYELYREGLAGLPGLKLYEHERGWRSNYQYVILQMEERAPGRGRDWLVEALTRENVLARRYFRPCGHELAPYAGARRGPLDATSRLTRSVFQLPSGQDVTPGDIKGVCELVRELLAVKRGA